MYNKILHALSALKVCIPITDVLFINTNYAQHIILLHFYDKNAVAKGNRILSKCSYARMHLLSVHRLSKFTL